MTEERVKDLVSEVNRELISLKEADNRADIESLKHSLMEVYAIQLEINEIDSSNFSPETQEYISELNSKIDALPDDVWLLDLKDLDIIAPVREAAMERYDERKMQAPFYEEKHEGGDLGHGESRKFDFFSEPEQDDTVNHIVSQYRSNKVWELMSDINEHYDKVAKSGVENEVKNGLKHLFLRLILAKQLIENAPEEDIILRTRLEHMEINLGTDKIKRLFYYFKVPGNAEIDINVIRKNVLSDELQKEIRDRNEANFFDECKKKLDEYPPNTEESQKAIQGLKENIDRLKANPESIGFDLRVKTMADECSAEYRKIYQSSKKLIGRHLGSNALKSIRAVFKDALGGSGTDKLLKDEGKLEELESKFLEYARARVPEVIDAEWQKADTYEPEPPTSFNV